MPVPSKVIAIAGQAVAHSGVQHPISPSTSISAIVAMVHSQAAAAMAGAPIAPTIASASKIYMIIRRIVRKCEGRFEVCQRGGVLGCRAWNIPNLANHRPNPDRR